MMTTAPTTTSSVMSAAYWTCGNQVFNSGIVVIRLPGSRGTTAELARVPEAAASVTFPFLLGRQAAAWVLMSSAWVDAAEAKDLGLAWKVVPAEDVLDEALALAKTFAVHPLDSLVATKRLLSATFSPAIAAGRERENAEFDVLLESPASRAAVGAFVAQRKDRHG